MKKNAYWYIGVILCIIFVTKIISIQVPIVIIDIIVMVFLLNMRKEDILYTLAFLLPLSVCFQASAHIWIIYMLVLFIKRMKYSVKFILLSLMFLLLEFFAHFYYGLSEINAVVTYVSYVLIFIYLVTEIKNDNISFNMMLKMYCASVPLLIMFYLLSAVITGGTDVLKVLFVDGARFGGTAGEEFSGMSISLNANTLAYYCISEIAIIMVLLKDGILKKWQKKIYVIVIVLTTIFGVLTGSRTFVIVFTLGMILFWFNSLKNRRQIIVASLLLLLICVAVIVALNANIPTVELLVERFGRDDMVSMNGRTDILSQYINRFFADDSLFFFGSGVADYGLVYGLEMSIHNGIMQALICYGIFGFMLFAYYVLQPVVFAIKRRQAFYKYIPVILCLVFVQTIQLLNPCILLFPFAISYMALLDGSSKKDLKEGGAVDNE